MQYCSLQTGHPYLQVIELGLTLRFVPRCDTSGRGGGTSDDRGVFFFGSKGRCSVPCWNLCVVRWLAHFFVEHGPWNMEHEIVWLVCFWNMDLKYGFGI